MIRQPEAERAFITAMIDLRGEHHLTQEDLAAKLTARDRPITKTNISWLETGRNRVTLADAMLIADLFGTDVAAMVARGQRRRTLLAHASGRWPK